MSESSDEEPSKEPLQQTNVDLNAADKFIVCQTQLMSLFTICPCCCGETQGNVEQQEGTYIKIKQVCAACGYERFWQNQPMLYRNMPACNLLLSGAIHFSGWDIRELKEMGGGLILSGDCRSDSPGHCAKYGTYSLIEDKKTRFWFFNLSSSEVPSSTWCELEGLKRSIDFLKEQHMHVSALITDRNRQVAKWVWEELCPGGTSHLFDIIWHIGKSLGKALDAAAKEREYEDLKLWRPAIINHLYWTAASTPDGDPDVMEAKWQSMVNHVQDIHEHGTPAFPCCAHPPLEGEARDKEWLEPASEPIPWRHFTPSSSTLHQSHWVLLPWDVAGFSWQLCTLTTIAAERLIEPVMHYAAALMESLSEGYSRSPETLRESSA
ncbi:hypothetical protein KUCAC02_022908, partial [Chaenocephalus aceratus]